MQFKLFCLIILFFTVHGLHAQNLASDSMQAEDSPKHKFYRLDAEPIMQPSRCASEILRSTDPLEKSGFLSNLNIQLKSTYSEDWKLDSIVATAWDVSSQTIKPSYWQVFNTLEDKLQFEIRNYRMDDKKGHWIINEAQYYNFNADGLLDSVEFQTHVTVNYILYKKFNYTYENGRLQAEVSKKKFDEFDDWEYLDRFEYEYDSLGRLERVYTQKKDPFNLNYWTTYEYVEYTYDSMGNVVRRSYFDYDDYEMVSTKTSELLYTYDEQNRLENIVEYVEGWQAGTLVEEAKQEYFYDEADRLIQVIISHWDYDLDNWLGKIHNSQDFDRGGDTLLVLETEFWDSAWILRDRVVYEAPNFIQKSNVQSSEFIFSFLPVYEQDGVACENIFNYERNSLGWQDRGVTTHYFSQIGPVDVPLVSKPSVKIYPNPTSDYLLVEGNAEGSYEIIIRDLNGHSLLHKKVQGNNRINVQSFSSGIYFIEIDQDGKRIFTDKFIKK
ncbi:MAG TPA: T9SS type A sorting domain-containing protein [Draconibacterium sp.]|nr:T9SS type A sorting domain-containing protein [Draconibacterium sp.]